FCFCRSLPSCLPHVLALFLCLPYCSFPIYCLAHHLDPLSFPTRRSSDLSFARFVITFFCKYSIIRSTGGSIAILRTSSFSPRFIAKIRWEAIERTASL